MASSWPVRNFSNLKKLFNTKIRSSSVYLLFISLTFSIKIFFSSALISLIFYDKSTFSAEDKQLHRWS